MKKWMFFKGVKIMLFATSAAIVFGYLVVWLWNALIPEIFHANPITFWQGIGLLVLSRILFGGFGHKWGGANRKHGMFKEKLEQKMASMSPEELMEFQAKWKNHCGYGWNRNNKRTEDIPTEN